MTTVTFSARLLTDAVISERSATTGGHRSLDYIPGGAFLGAAAATLYERLGDGAFTVFHSGRVRFGNAYPLSEDGEPALPIPLAWHVQKGEELNESVTKVKTLSHAADDDFAHWERHGIQQKQLRSGYFTLSGRKIDPNLNYRLKTAISREKYGRAEESQLFGYQSLAAGSRWYFGVDFDADVPTSIIEQVTAALTGRIRVGRSRSAEYGLLETQVVDTPTLPVTAGSGGTLIVYCVSDLALADRDTGCPVLTPDGTHFGLPHATLNLQKSYLRHRRYAPFNGKRRRFDLERQVIVKGSVLVFEQEGGVSQAELDPLRQRLEPGIGLYRQDGLGRVIVNPSFLRQVDFTPAAGPKLPLFATPETATKPPLAEWLTARSEERQEEIEAVTLVDAWISELVAGSCPKNSQWGQLRNIALQSRDLDDMKKRVKRLCSEGISQKQWMKPVKIRGKRMEYRVFLLETVLGTAKSAEAARKRLYLLGNRLPRANNQRTGGDQ